MKSLARACFFIFGMLACAVAVSAQEAVVERKSDIGFFNYSLGYFLPITGSNYILNFGSTLEGGVLLGGFFKVGVLMNYGIVTGQALGIRFTEEYIAGGGLFGFAIPIGLSDTGRPAHLLSLDYGIMGARGEARVLGVRVSAGDTGHLFRIGFESLVDGSFYIGSHIAYITHQDIISDIFYVNASFTLRF